MQNIGLVYTTLAAADNKKITIPNGSISNGAVINVTAQESGGWISRWESAIPRT